jgi:hypothetical protein
MVLNFLAVLICFLSSRISVPTLIGWDSKKQGLLQAYVLGWVGVLVVLLYLAREPGQLALILPEWLILGLALYRLQDLLFSSVDDAMELTSTYRDYDDKGRILILLVNLVEIILIFAIAYLVLVGPQAITTAMPPNHHITNIDYFVQSWNTLAPFGSAAPAAIGLAPQLGMAEAVVSLLIVVIALSAFVGREK